ncbi:aspartate-semialdehyde dehydrogenase [uncultured Pseudomonas sp.]|uniref:aspartate-semialdehyde dehydrogenase n=1 Tax=uncultured Pseudomonas sp. TaxID=114707 RepID=UPI0025DB9B92|nr:aspartate-semialdehyde dehydrogenase [uncultured Pseudomonas sp.]
MLQPMLPLSVVPVTSQLDPAKRLPEIPPVVPTQPSGSDNSIDLRHDDAEQAALRLREEQERQQRQQRGEAPPEHDQEEGPLVVPGDSLNADNTVPVVPLIDNEPRQGLWVDVEV